MAEPLPDWLRPEGGLTAADLDRLPGLPEHTELIDGGLHFMSPQRAFHLLVIELLGSALRAVVPPGWLIRKNMSVVLADRTRVEPDVLVVAAHAEPGPLVTSYPAAAVRLVVEVVSPDSITRDRELKPVHYAHAGIPHFWRVEGHDTGVPVLHLYTLDAASQAYALTGIHHDRLTVDEPFSLDISLDLTGL